VLVVPVVGAVATPTQRRRHALGDPVPTSRHMPVVSPVPGPLPLPPGKGLSGTTALAIKGDTSKDVMEIHNEHDFLRDIELLEDSSSNRDDRSMEIDNACLGQLIDIVHLDDSQHKVGKPRQKQLKKKKSTGKRNGGHQGGQQDAKRRYQAEDLGSDH